MADESATAAKLKRLERSSLALDLRKTGLAYREIAKMVAEQRPELIPKRGYSAATAYRDVRSVLEETAKEYSEEAENLRTLELQRLDDMLSSIWDRVISGSTEAINTALRIMERRARLVGLDKPELVDMVVGHHDERVQWADLATRILSSPAMVELASRFFRELATVGSDDADGVLE